MKFHGFLRICARRFDVVLRLNDVELDSVDHLALASESRVVCSEMPAAGGTTPSHLRLNQGGHVDEHVVQIFDALLQFDDITVSRLDIGQRLLRLGCLDHYLAKTSASANAARALGRFAYALREYSGIARLQHLFHFTLGHGSSG